jgi:hypothetical protein
MIIAKESLVSLSSQHHQLKLMQRVKVIVLVGLVRTANIVSVVQSRV